MVKLRFEAASVTRHRLPRGVGSFCRISEGSKVTGIIGGHTIGILIANSAVFSFCGVLIYYGIGFGLGGKFGPARYIPIALVVFIFQLILSHWWLRYMDYSPLEWIGRQLT